ncbi:hypothetical protein Q7P37_004670 [Cladosporium fusiforme]
MVCVAQRLVCAQELHDSSRPLVLLTKGYTTSIAHETMWTTIPRSHACAEAPKEEDRSRGGDEAQHHTGASPTPETWYVIISRLPHLPPTHVLAIAARMNATNESFAFTGGWQDNSFGESTINLDGSFPTTSGGQIDTAGFFQEPGAASPPDGWLTAQPAWLQHDSSSMYGGSPPAEYAHSFPSYTTAQGYVYDGVVAELSDVDQCNSQSSFSESDFDQFYAAHRDNLQIQNFPQLPVTSPTSGNLQHHQQHQQAANAQALRNDIQAQIPVHQHVAHPAQPSQQASLHIPPPARTLSPTDPLYPRQQPSRWIGDLYTPTYVRGDGSNRAGWCGNCPSWLTLKDSAYWYHKHFAHGISCATGAHLPGPVRQRPTAGAARGVGDCEALCGGCSRWVLVVAGERGRTAWYMHAYRCLLKNPAAKEKMKGKSASPRKVAAKPALGGPSRS